MKTRTLKQGFTLVELLVVIAIIGILVALLLPSLNAVREAANNISCKNNMAGLGKAALSHQSRAKSLPPGAFLAKNGTVPTGYGTGSTNKPGATDATGAYSAIVKLLPDMEANAIFDSIDQSEGPYAAGTSTRQYFRPRRDQQLASGQAIPSLYCPSRSNSDEFTTSTELVMLNLPVHR